MAAVSIPSFGQKGGSLEKLQPCTGKLRLRAPTVSGWKSKRASQVRRDLDYTFFFYLYKNNPPFGNALSGTGIVSHVDVLFSSSEDSRD